MKKILSEGIKLWMQRGPGNFNFVYHPGYAATVVMSRQHNFAFDFVLVFIKNNMFLWAYNESDMIKMAEIIIENEEKDSEYTSKLISEWKERVDDYYRLCKKIDETNLSNLSDEDLKNLFSNFCMLYAEEYAIPIMADSISFYCEIELKKKLKTRLKELGMEKEYANYLTSLTNPVEDSFIGEESKNLFLITKKYIEGKPYESDLKEHAKKWHWIQNNYLRSIVLDETYFLNRIKEHAKNLEFIQKNTEKGSNQFELAKSKKESLIKDLRLDKQTELLIKLVDEYCIWQDMRKKANLIAQYYLTLFIEEIGKRKKISEDIIKLMIPEEIISLLDKTELDFNMIKSRKNGVGTIFTPKKITVFNENDSALLDKDIEEQCTVAQVNEFYGSIANLGKVTAKARILNGPEDFSKMIDGEVLVTSMTRPEFLPIMKKAIALITDEGGLTCHAAIVSREFNIPCIVGTKIATKVLKDGDLVEVNANHGIVRKLR